VIEIRSRARESQAVLGSLEVFGSREVPGWLSSDPNAFKVTVNDLPVRSQIDAPVTEQAIVELYSK
jgi:small subunit ribosomal protein S4